MVMGYRLLVIEALTFRLVPCGASHYGCCLCVAPHCASLVWGYLRFARVVPSGLLKEYVYYIHFCYLLSVH